MIVQMVNEERVSRKQHLAVDQNTSADMRFGLKGENVSNNQKVTSSK